MVAGPLFFSGKDDIMTRFSLRSIFAPAAREHRRAPARSVYRLRLEELEDRLVPSTLRVGPTEPYHTIQAAVNAAHAGDTIRVDAGTYQEQVKIGAGKDGITLDGANQASVIKAPVVLTSPNAVVEVSGAHNVTIDGFTIEGPASTANSGGRLYGIRIDGGGSATITHNHITAIEDTPFDGVQEGIAILVGRAFEGQTGSATITHNTIDNYQKGGIVVDNTGSSAEIDHNEVVGAGPTALIAQNGIQISRGATADVNHNDISGNIYSPQTDASTGIILYLSGAVTLDHNTISDNDVGIYAQGANGAVIDHNDISGSTFDGIFLYITSGAQVDHNTTNNNGSNNPGDGGIALYSSTNNTIDHNISNNNNGDGIFVDSTSTGNSITHNHMSENTNLDAEDLSVGSGTAGTGNVWDKNDCSTDNHGGGLCGH
jgi:parallel beta-helix repeat protein